MSNGYGCGYANRYGWWVGEGVRMMVVKDDEGVMMVLIEDRYGWWEVRV